MRSALAPALVIGVAVCSWSSGPCLAARPFTDEWAADRVARANRLLAKGKVGHAIDVLESLVRVRPHFAPALTLLCETETELAGSWAVQPVYTGFIRDEFTLASIACARAAAVETAPSVRARRAWAFTTLMAGPEADRVHAYEAWAAAEPFDPIAAGTLAAFLDDAGRAEEADAVLARVATLSAPLGDRARLAFACRNWESRDRVLPMMQRLESADLSPREMAMVGVLKAYVESGEKTGDLALLGRLEDGSLDDATARRLWGCLGGDVSFLTATDDEHDAEPCETLPVQQGSLELPYPKPAKTRQDEGKVLIFYRINTDGTTGPVWVAGATNPEFAAAAVAYARQLRYTPATCSGVPIPYPAVMQYNFSLPESPSPDYSFGSTEYAHSAD